MQESTQPIPAGEFLTVDELAAMTRRSVGALYVERHRGEGIGALAVKCGRRLLWRRADVDRWFDQQLGR